MSAVIARRNSEVTMRAQLLTAARRPLVAAELPAPRTGPGQLLIAVRACAVCRTDLHVIDGELAEPKLPLVPGHEIIGTVVDMAAAAERFAIGDRVGVPWLGWTCGICEYCRGGHENLCDRARFTGYQIDGGYAELTVADERYCFAIDPSYGDIEAAPLMCAGLIGYRTLRMAGDARRVGSTASAPPRTSWRKWRAIRAGACSPLLAPATWRRRISRAGSAPSGRAIRQPRRPSRSTRH